MAKKKDDLSDHNFDNYPDFDLGDIGFTMGDIAPPSFWQEPDFLLADIVHMLVNLAGLEIGITLFVKGMTLTGVLISEETYLKDLSDTFRQRVQIADKKMTKKERKEFDEMFDFTRMAESRLAQELGEQGVMMPEGVSSIRHLHLKNPMLVGTEGAMDFGHAHTPYIRLRLTLIDGWMLGEVVTASMFRDDDPDQGEILH